MASTTCSSGSSGATTSSKVKVSVTLSRDAIRLIDEGVRRRRYASRSAALQDAVDAWLRGERRRLRDREIVAYYSGQTAAEIEEELDWARLGRVALARLGADRHRPSPRRPAKPELRDRSRRRVARATG